MKMKVLILTMLICLITATNLQAGDGGNGGNGGNSDLGNGGNGGNGGDAD